jgi:hypothetical protein
MSKIVRCLLRAYYTWFTRFWQTPDIHVLTREVFRDIVLSSLTKQSAILKAGVTNLERTEKLTGFLDKLVLALAKHWLSLVNLVIAVYDGLPFLAPTLMVLGFT